MLWTVQGLMDSALASVCLPDKHSREFGSMTFKSQQGCTFWPGHGEGEQHEAGGTGLVWVARPVMWEED